MSNIHNNVKTLRRLLKLTQHKFLSQYLTDTSGNMLMGVSKFSNFENRGSKDEKKIARMLAEKFKVAEQLFSADEDTFLEGIDSELKKEIQLLGEKNEHGARDESNVIKLVSTINDYLVEEIIAGNLAPGMRLPSDRELAKHFQVGRTILREALKVLHVLGLLEISPGQGTFITKSSQHFFTAPLSWSFYLDSTNINHVLDIRNILEKESAKLAATNGDEETLKQLTHVYEQTAQAYKNGDFAGFLDLDLDFHLAISFCSKNPIIQSLLTATRKLVLQESTLALTNKSQLANIHQEHTAIYQAIIIKDPLLAQIAMTKHLDEFSKRSKENKSHE